MSDHFKSNDKEMKAIEKELVKLEIYKDLFDIIPDFKKEDNNNGCAVNRILCHF
jgi:hypothetical protein